METIKKVIAELQLIKKEVFQKNIAAKIEGIRDQLRKHKKAQDRSMRKAKLSLDKVYNNVAGPISNRWNKEKLVEEVDNAIEQLRIILDKS